MSEEPSEDGRDQAAIRAAKRRRNVLWVGFALVVLVIIVALLSSSDLGVTLLALCIVVPIALRTIFGLAKKADTEDKWRPGT